MPIWYDWMREGWIDDEDENFFVDMTPEGGVDPDSYNDRESFYNDGFQHVKDNITYYTTKKG